MPGAWRNDPSDFLNLVRTLQIDQLYPEEYSRRYVDALQKEPSLANELSWCLEAIGPKAIPFLWDLYEADEIVPRMAALRAGARLDDARAAQPLADLARNATGVVRTESIELLALIDAGPTIDMTLRELTMEDELTVRASAYEALARRAEEVQLNRLLHRQRERLSTDPRAIPLPPSHLEELAKLEFSGGTVQGISREVVEGKFILDIVPYGKPMVYITQQGRPRIVIFGDNPTLRSSMLVSTWSDRLMIDGDSASNRVRIYYRDVRDEHVTTHTMKPGLVEFIRFLAHEPTPSDPHPGLGLSYSEVVGALYAVHQAKGMDAAFTTERDKLLAQILEAQAGTELAERPEGEADRQRLQEFKQPDKPINLPEPTRAPFKPKLEDIAPPPEQAAGG